MLNESDTYDYGFNLARGGHSFDRGAKWLAIAATCSDAFVRQYEALERGYAEGMRIVMIEVKELGLAKPSYFERVADAGYALDDPKGRSVL